MRTATQAIAAAKSARRYHRGWCQNWTHNLYLAPAAGDRDHDGDADAVDGWKSESPSARFTDRKPMIGAPVAWSGGSSNFGHRAICVGYNAKGEPMIRSTDAGGPGVIATRPLSWFEKEWHLKYLGWSKTITGKKIVGLKPGPNPAAPAKTRGPHVDAAIAELNAGLKLATEGSAAHLRFRKGLYQLRTIFPIIGSH